MGKNQFGGKHKHKKRVRETTQKKDLSVVDVKDPNQYYAAVLEFHGTNVSVKYIRNPPDGVKEEITANGIVRGKIFKRCKRLIKGQVLIISERPFESGKVDVLHLLTDEELYEHKHNGEFSQEFKNIVSSLGLNNNESHNTTEIEFNHNMEEDDSNPLSNFNYDYNYSDDEEEDGLFRLNNNKTNVFEKLRLEEEEQRQKNEDNFISDI